MNDDCTKLDWKPVLLVKVTRLPFGEIHTGLSVKRLYLAQHHDGILRADWTLPADERYLPLVQLTGWKPERDVPFALPVQYQRGSGHSAAVIPTGTWVLPYDGALPALRAGAVNPPYRVGAGESGSDGQPNPANARPLDDIRLRLISPGRFCF